MSTNQTIQFNRIKEIIFNTDNELKHMESIREMVEKFQDENGVCGLSISLWKNYNTVYNIITKNNQDEN